ncbi:FKBP-type peptidyl-prolyl cis-trans isomerase [Candidatus Xenohaliotis californiensis]|uniref:FKBP-type peptidyl-prolyl cis-trans isomerase n=1 Tax=Candidatus Xenohaliotis californiensis TaxID=84677 RepID=UPI0030C7EE0D
MLSFLLHCNANLNITKNINANSSFFSRIRTEVLQPIVFDEIHKYTRSMIINNRVVDSLFPGFALHVNENFVGFSNKVFCGQKVKLSLYGYTENPKRIFHHRRNGIVIVQLGHGVISKAIDLASIGMKIGGQRVVRLPSNMPLNPSLEKVMHPANNDMVYNIELLEILNYVDLDPLDLIIDHRNENLGNMAFCGDRVMFDLLISRMNGEILHEAKAIETTIGSFEQPIAVELGLENSLTMNKTFVVLPIEFIKDKNGIDEKFQALSLNEKLVAEIFLHSIIDQNIAISKQ